MHEHDVSCATAPLVYPPPPRESRLYRAIMAVWTHPTWLAPVLVLACLGTAFSYVLAFNPADAKPDPLGPCAFRAITGLDCPGCGGTRMVWFLLHGDVLQAARHHAIALLVVPVLVYAYLAWGAKRIFNLTLPTRSIPTLAWVSFLGLWAVFSVVRNLPWEPFLYFRV